MNKAFALGNGTSRLEVDPSVLKQLGLVYGCNALYREFTPDVLISTDKPISEHIQHSGYAKSNKFYTRRPLPGLGGLEIPQKYFGFSSGPIAVGLAALDKNPVIYMIGFDLGPDLNGKFNNVYADTEFYKKSSAVPTFTGNWVRQIVQLSKDFKDCRFFRVQGNVTADIPELKKISNFVHMPMIDFLDRINNTKDL